MSRSAPIYATTLKRMPWPPQGLPRIAEWREQIGCPLVAIGGITLGRAPLVLAVGRQLRSRHYRHHDKPRS